MQRNKTDVIAAIATPAGRGGIGVVRVSGPDVAALAKGLLGGLPKPRYAAYTQFHDAAGHPIDQGIALYFPAPHSFTGEHVLELQGHGGPAVMQALLARCQELGARLAGPGEFTYRAFLNGKLDLAQAESVVDLIDASSAEAARSALHSLSIDAEGWLADHARRDLRLDTLLAERLPKRFAQQWCAAHGVARAMKELGEAKLRGVAADLACWRVLPSGTLGYAKAEVTLGRVDTRALSSKTMAARDVPDLFFIGEVVDVTGWLGGYNFQWAWASGQAAGEAVAARRQPHG